MVLCLPMVTHELIAVQRIPASLEDVWRFFTNPRNLRLITPPYLDFQFLDKQLPAEIYSGQKIRYTVSPILGIPVQWISTITRVEEQKMFVDEQLSGPYKYWRHEHRFEEKLGMIEMNDRVSYQMPMGLLGSFAHYLFVKRQLEKLFAYREMQVANIFGTQALQGLQTSKSI